ncbi:MAG: hypothetical protein ACU833_07145 [Gammaproteobacteria bacterium]
MKIKLGTPLLLAVGFIFLAPLPVVAEPSIVPMEDVRYDVNLSMGENLKILLSKKVTVTVSSGKSFTGYVKVLSSKLLHLEKLEDKDFYDALIRIDDIQAIETRFRTVNR